MAARGKEFGGDQGEEVGICKSCAEFGAGDSLGSFSSKEALAEC